MLRRRDGSIEVFRDVGCTYGVWERAYLLCISYSMSLLRTQIDIFKHLNNNLYWKQLNGNSNGHVFLIFDYLVECITDFVGN